MPSRHPICIAGNPIVPRARWSRSTEEAVEGEINVRQMERQVTRSNTGNEFVSRFYMSPHYIRSKITLRFR
jgi:hypothetical protein